MLKRGRMSVTFGRMSIDFRGKFTPFWGMFIVFGEIAMRFGVYRDTISLIGRKAGLGRKKSSK